LHQKDNEYRNRISILEQQLLRQRERSMALVEEKDKEILTLKASFRAFLPNKRNWWSDRESNRQKKLGGKEGAPRFEF